MKKVQVLIAAGYGINCEKEVEFACRMAGAETDQVHAQALVTQEIPLNQYDLIVFPGGFAFGDELGAGKVFANRITHGSGLKEKLLQFVDQGKCILGICNGFQLLTKLGLLPGQERSALAANAQGHFENRWVYHRVEKSPCIFTQGLTRLYLPIRHGEGRLLCNAKIPEQQIPLRYATEEGSKASTFPDNPNGSTDAIAALCDPTGRILGMMAHPEAALQFTNDPRWLRERERLSRKGEMLPPYADGYAIFHNAIQYLAEQK